MAFVIRIPKEYASPKFNNYILARLVNEVSNSLSRSSYQVADKALAKYLGQLDLNVNFYSLISYYIRTFSIEEKPDCYLVGDNGSEKIAGTDKTIESAVRIAEYGVSGIKPVPRISKVINSIQSNLQEIYEKWRDKSEKKG